MTRRIVLFGAASAISLSVASPVMAQQATQAEPDSGAMLEQIVVTGSRIQRAGFEAPTPLTTVQTEDLQRSAPGALADGLNQLPQFQNSISSAQRSVTLANAQATGNYLNMRALGTQRVLILQDGQRLVPSGNNGSVDVSLIPSMLIERTDVVTGGASAVYGSDAVSGVVNFVLNKRYEGFKAVAQYGEAKDGVVPSYKFGAAGGIKLTARLHVIASAEHYHTDALVRKDVPTIGQGWYLAGVGTAASPLRSVRDARVSTVSTSGFVVNGPFANQQFDANGNLRAFDPGIPSGNAGISIGGDGAIFSQTNGSTTSSQTMTQVFVRPEFEFSDDVTGFIALGYNDSEYKGNPGPAFRRQTRLFADNAFLTPTVRAALGTTASFDVGRLYEGPGLIITQTNESMIANAGLSGTFGDGYNWDVGISHHRTEFGSQQVDLENEKYYAAIDAVRDPAGNTVCRVTLTNPTLYPGCIPLNITGSYSEDAYRYTLGLSKWAVENEMDAVQANLTGHLFDLPGGPVSFAIGAEYREQTLEQTSNSNPLTPPAFAGLRGVLPNFMLRYGILNTGVGEGSVDVTEGYGEFTAPLFTDTAAGSLEVSGAARLTDYSTSGEVTTWKIGALFDPVKSVRVRATFSRDIRAPTLFELFAGQQTASQPISDSLTGQNTVVQIVSGGNPDLNPENAETFTGGLVIRPAFAPGLSLSVDYYRIEIEDSIASPFTYQQILSLCETSNYTSSLCNQIIRPLGPTDRSPGNTPSAILTVVENLASQLTSGVDFEAAYSFDLGGGRASIRALGSRLIDFDQTNAAGQPVRHLAGNADFAQLPLPKWRGLIDLSYRLGDFMAGVQGRYIGAFNRSDVQVYEQNRIGAIFYTDLNASYSIPTANGALELFGVVNNAFDKKAPLAPVAFTPGLSPPHYVNVHDILGRYVTVGARIQF